MSDGARASQEWANVIVDKEDRYEERIAGSLTAMSQREVVIELTVREKRAEPTLAGFGNSGRRSFEIRKMG
jgi:hypothetical protein